MGIIVLFSKNCQKDQYHCVQSSVNHSLSHLRRVFAWPNFRQASEPCPRSICEVLCKNPALVRPLLSHFNQHLGLPNIWSGSSSSTTSSSSSPPPNSAYPHLPQSPEVTYDQPSLTSARILLGQDSRTTIPHPWYFLLVIFYPLPPALFLGYKSPLAHAIFRIDPGSTLKSPLPVAIVLNKISFYCVITVQLWVFFYNIHH